jgi:Zn-dependent peptidase ImmA (M78 family)/plasmid maintenance system antidote protein VapI
LKGNRTSGRPPHPRALARLVGERVRLAREAAGFSQGDLAEALGRTRASVSLWEKGERALGVDDLLELAGVLDRSPDFFLPQHTMGARDQERAAVTLRAVASQLSGAKVSPEIATVIAKAEQIPPPPRLFKPRTREPIEAAQELLSAMRVGGPPVAVDEAAELAGARVVPHPFSSDALSGFLIHLSDGPVISTNDNHKGERQRFTAAHELGHLLMGHAADFHLDLTSSVNAGDPPDFDWRHERAANTFAANLLMPAGWVRSDFVDRGLRVVKLARRYQVSQEAMGIRLATLGLS